MTSQNLLCWISYFRHYKCQNAFTIISHLLRQHRQAGGLLAPPPGCSLAHTAPADWGLGPGLWRTERSGRPQLPQPGQLLLEGQTAEDWQGASHKWPPLGQQSLPRLRLTGCPALVQPWCEGKSGEWGTPSGGYLLHEKSALHLGQPLYGHYGNSQTIRRIVSGQFLLCRHSDMPAWPVKVSETLGKTGPMVWGEKSLRKRTRRRRMNEMVARWKDWWERWRGWWV